MKITTLLFAILFTANFYAQSDNASSTIRDGIKIKKADRKGHPFLFDDWTIGYLVNKEGQITEKKLYNYDIYNNKLLFKANTEGDVLAIDESQYTGFFLKGTRDYVFIKVEGSSFVKTTKNTKYYELGNPPSNKVLIESIKSFKDPNTSGWNASKNNNKSGEYKLIQHYYILGKDEKYHRVKLSTNSVLKVFKDQKTSLTEYLKNENIHIQSPADLVRITEKYYSL